MPEVRIEAEPRTEFGKGASRAIRREGRVPAVMYGHGAENRHFTLPEHELMLALKTPNALIRVEGLSGRPALALPKAVQRHAIKGVIEHIDLIEVRSGEKVTVVIPIRVNGEVFSGGLLDQQMVQLSVEAEATHLPDGVDIDVEGIQIGTQVFAKDLALPQGTTLAGDPEALILHVVATQTQAQFDEEIGESEETEAAAEVPAPVAAEAAE
ncbi:MAG TPA: 50S ribosomal protein L25/general stress protein Ctc [Trebonia sp.]